MLSRAKGLCVCIALTAMVSCSSYATAVYRHQDKHGTTTITVQSPPDPVRPPVITVGDTRISGGTVQATDQALAGLSGTTGWLGAALIALGVVALIARVWLPYVPIVAPMVLIAAGGGVLMLPVLVDRYSLEIGLGIALAVVAGGYELWTHRRDWFAQPPERPIKPHVPIAAQKGT